jgi:hypothetical protein
LRRIPEKKRFLGLESVGYIPGKLGLIAPQKPPQRKAKPILGESERLLNFHGT